MPYDYSKLLGRITEVFGTQGRFADEMDLSERTVSLKLNNKIGWKQSEIRKAVALLKISPDDIPLYFFAEQLQN